MNVLVTGAAGFLGRHFAKHHVYLDHHVVAVDDFSSPYASWPSDLGPIHRRDAAAFLTENGHSPYDIVYHFAAPVGGREKIEGDPLFNADSLRLDAALFRWAAQAKPRVIVYPSSSAVYGLKWQQKSSHRPLTEKDFDPKWMMYPHPDAMYGFTKMVGEYLAWVAESYGVNTLCIRPFSGYGEDQSLEYPVPSIVARVLAREDPLTVWGPGTQTRDFIYVTDVVGATLARVRHGVKGYQAMNIGTGVQTSFNEIAALAVEGVPDYDPDLVNLPDKPFGVWHRYADPTLMQQYYSPKVSLREGLARMLRG